MEAQVLQNHRRVNRLRQAVLRWAFEGRLVDQDASDELASILLQRIRAERRAHGDAQPKLRGRGKAARPESGMRGK